VAITHSHQWDDHRGGGASTAFAAVGRFTADGAGNLTNGELDTNGIVPQEKLIAQPFTGTYQIRR